MDTLTFFTKVLEYVAWPITVLIFSFLFRRSISRVIDSIRLKKVKRGDLEIDFYQQLSELKEVSQALPAPKKLVTSRIAKRIPFRTSESPMDEDLRTLVQSNPTAAINLSWAYVDRELRTAIMRLGISTDYPKEGSSIRYIRLLKQDGFIDDTTFDLLMGLRDLRDKSAHLLNDPNLIAEDAQEYDELAKRMIKELSALKSKKLP